MFNTASQLEAVQMSEWANIGLDLHFPDEDVLTSPGSIFATNFAHLFHLQPVFIGQNQPKRP